MNIPPSDRRAVGSNHEGEQNLLAPQSSASAATHDAAATTPPRDDRPALPSRLMSTERQRRLELHGYFGSTPIAAPENLSPVRASAAALRAWGTPLTLPPEVDLGASPGTAGISPRGAVLSFVAPRQIHRRRRALAFDESHVPPTLIRTRQIRDLLQEIPRPQQDTAVPLEESVASWNTTINSEALATLQSRWSAFSAEDGATSFGRFLVKLNNENMNAESKLFRQQTADLLDQMSNDPQLRQQVFAISVEATTSCQDRVSHAMVMMQGAARTARFMQTEFAGDAGAVLVQRQFHRLDLLHNLAQTIVKETGNGGEELETHLHLLIRHVDALKLTDAVPSMAMFYDGCSRIDGERSAKIPAEIKGQENDKFSGWLMHSPSWLDYIARIDKPRFDAAQEARDTLFETEFQQRLDARLVNTGLNKEDEPAIWADAERGLGTAVHKEMVDEINTGMTRDFLTARGNLHLLDKYWPDHECTVIAHAAVAHSVSV